MPRVLCRRSVLTLFSLLEMAFVCMRIFERSFSLGKFGSLIFCHRAGRCHMPFLFAMVTWQIWASVSIVWRRYNMLPSFTQQSYPLTVLLFESFPRLVTFGCSRSVWLRRLGFRGHNFNFGLGFVEELARSAILLF